MALVKMLLATARFVITTIPVLLSVLLPKVPRSIGWTDFGHLSLSAGTFDLLDLVNVK